jgi:hypothetical protein
MAIAEIATPTNKKIPPQGSRSERGFVYLKLVYAT